MAGERVQDGLAHWRRVYRVANRAKRGQLLTDFCQVMGYCRKYAITLLNGEFRPPKKRRRPRVYNEAVTRFLREVWSAAGYPWSTRLKALIPLWLPFLKGRHPTLSESEERLLLAISPRQMDRVLKPMKAVLRRRLFGRTKPGTLLKHAIPVKTEHWDVNDPGTVEIDLVAHCGNRAEGEFAHTLNVTDIYSGWSASRAVLGKGEKAVVSALDEIRMELPFILQKIDSDNGSEFINNHLVRYCRQQGIEFVRGRPYKKDDNAHIEQKNWTHVRKIFGYARYEGLDVVEAMNALYRGDLRLMMNLFQPSVKLLRKERIGGRVRRTYDRARTPLDRIIAWHAQTEAVSDRSHEDGPVPLLANQAPERTLATLKRLRSKTDPFELAQKIDRYLLDIETIRGRPPLTDPSSRHSTDPRRQHRRAA